MELFLYLIFLDLDKMDIYRDKVGFFSSEVRKKTPSLPAEIFRIVLSRSR